MSLEPKRWPGVGSGPYTLDKLACFDGWLNMLITISAGMMRRYPRWPRQYTVIDLNAAPGRYLLDNGHPVDGTPLLALRRLAASRLPDWRAAFVERDGDMTRDLRGWLDLEAEALGLDRSRYVVLTGDHTDVVLPWVAQSVPPGGALGVLLHDPNGAPDFRLLERLVRERRLSRFDVAVYVQATSLKRVLNLDPRRYNISDWRPLDEALARIKPHWVVREPVGSNQYALCIGSNGELPAWARQHFWPTTSDRGRAIFEQLTLTTGERQRRLQPPLFPEV